MFKKISDLLSSKRTHLDEFKENWKVFHTFYENLLSKSKLLDDKKMLEKKELTESIGRISNLKIC